MTRKKPVRKHPPTLRLRAVVPRLAVSDIGTSLAWYRDVMGFAVSEQLDHQGQVIGVALKAGIAEFLLVQDESGSNLGRGRCEGVRLTCITAQDVAALAAQVKARGGRLLEEPRDGIQQFTIADPDGYELLVVGAESARGARVS